MTKKQAKPSFTTPKGIFQYPALSKPDYGNDEYPKPEGQYKVNIVLSRDEAQPLIDKLQPLYDEAISEGQQKFDQLKVEQRKKLKEMKVGDLYTEVYDPETEEPTGEVVFKFSAKASGVNKKKETWKRSIPIFDAKGIKMVKVPNIGGGTVGKVSFEASPYFVAGQGMAGLKLYLSAAQVIELSEWGSKSAGAYGFGEEDGYEYDPSAQTEDETAADENSSEDGPVDF